VTVLLDDHAWIAWLALIVTAVVMEMRRLDLRGLCGGVAALAALLSGLVGAPWWLQALVAVVVAVALLRTARPALLRALPIETPRADDDPGSGDARPVPTDDDPPA
jgi:membrane protein implicated in regulation of membrane protease activity